MYVMCDIYRPFTSIFKWGHKLSNIPQYQKLVLSMVWQYHGSWWRAYRQWICSCISPGCLPKYAHLPVQSRLTPTFNLPNYLLLISLCMHGLINRPDSTSSLRSFTYVSVKPCLKVRCLTHTFSYKSGLFHYFSDPSQPFCQNIVRDLQTISCLPWLAMQILIFPNMAVTTWAFRYASWVVEQGWFLQ